jgi:Tfp pilus assembly protein PilF
MGHGGGFPDAFARARAAAARAEELGGEGLGEMYVALGTIKLSADWDLSEAGRDLQRAVELNPSIAEAHRMYSWYLFAVGQREDALASMRRAQEVDPVNPWYYPDRGWQYWAMGQYDNAIAEARKSLDLVPDYGFGLVILGMAYAGKEMYAEAIAAHERLAAIAPDTRCGLAITYAQAGREDDARRILTECLAQEPPPTGGSAGWDVAEAYAALGDTEEALEWLEAAYRERLSLMPWTKDNPLFAPLRSDPRFQDLLRRINPAE